MKIIDTHCHVYPDAIADRASKGIGSFYDYPIAGDGRVDTLLALGGEAGIGRHIVSSVATTPHQVSAINRFLHGAAAAHPERLTALGALHPDSEDGEADVQQILDLGLRGVKLHPDVQKIAIDDPRMFALFALCEGRLPVLCHLGDTRYDYSNPARVRRVLENFPRLTLIGAHFGGWSLWRQAAEALHGCERLLVDSSSSLFALSPEEAAALVRLYGADRVLFGVDYPMWTPGEELNRFLALPLTEDERERVLYKNAAALYGLAL